MRIVIISDVYFPRINGVSTSIRTFRRELEYLGHEVLLIAPDYGESTEDEAGILRIPSREIVVDPEDRMMRYRSVLATEKKLQEFDPDLVHIQTPFVAHYAGTRLARKLGIPAILTYHTYFEEYLFHYIRFVPRFILRWSVRHLSRRQCSQVDTVVVPTHAFNEVLNSYGVKTGRHIVPTGIELDRFVQGDGERFKRQHSIDVDRPCLVFVGRVVHEKNIRFLIEVIDRIRQHHPDILFVIAGEGPAEDDLQSQVSEMKLQHNVSFIGYLQTQQALNDCYCAGDAFIFASRTETQGLVLLEAMALGVPVISTAKMGTHDILDKGKGAIVAKEELEDFSQKVLKLLGDKTLAQSLGKEGRDYALSWSSSVIAQNMLEIYQQSLDSYMTIKPLSQPVD